MAFVPVEWLSEHVEVPAGTTAEELAADLVKVGLEEEGVVEAAVTGPLVVGKVLTREANEQKNGKVINYCRVDVGRYNDQPGEGKEPSDLPSRGIICGAHNFDVGDLVVCSLPGAVLPGGFEISARKTYGHISDGMICSERELGIGEGHDGIIVLTEKFAPEQIPQPGESVMELLGLACENLEINITPDRGYCFSMRGVAREYSHSTGATFTDPGLAENLPGGHVAPPSDDGFPVHLADTAPIRQRQGCDRFVARLITGVDPHAQTPAWMVKRLEAAGMRSISLAVDVTNYVMLDLGQPLHAYDADTVHGPIVVRRANPGETLTTLDDIERNLDPEDLCICDSLGGEGKRVLGLAGVMGGAQTEISDTTQTILLEAAHFDPVSVARTARRHKLPTEAAKRNERGVDPELAPVAAQVAAHLLVTYGGGEISARVTDINETTPIEPIRMRASEPSRLVGVDYAPERIEEILTLIGCLVRRENDDFIVTPPTWRPDLVGPAHLVEEIARLDGYDRIPSVRPPAPAGRGLTGLQRARRAVAGGLAGAGLTQVLSYPFIGDAHDRQGFADHDDRRRVVTIANPLADDQPALRTSILDTLLVVAERNVARGMDDLALFEIGRVTDPQGCVPAEIPGVDRRPSEEECAQLAAGVPAQPWHVGVVLSGRVAPAGFESCERHFDYRDAFDAVRAIAHALGLDLECVNPHGPDHERLPFHTGRVGAVMLGSQRIGWAGELHPRVVKEYGLAPGASGLEIDLDPALVASSQRPPVEVAPVSTYPVVKEDMAFVADESVDAAVIEQSIREAGAGLVESVSLFDVFRGEQIGDGKKSLAFALRLRAPDRTLSTKEIAAARKKIVKKVRKASGANLRA
ncbi:MAG: phenylalanine--tRNA ligase subunit beta [Actinomycetaceae bacterium]|nr:phenylalanine--tRNA ligase subunit beta [Actinomycetaceae bacterium]